MNAAIKRSLLSLCVTPLLGNSLFAQTDTQNSQKGPTYVKTQPRSGTSHIETFSAEATGPVCTNPPSVSDLKPFGHFSQMSVQDAANLKLTFPLAGGSGSWSQQSQVIVWRQGKTYTCPSADGKYTVVYGSEWDSAIAISQTELKGDVSFATIAANVQINKSSTSYDYVGGGYTDTSQWEAANSKLLKDISTDGLTVKSYSTFDADFGDGLAKAAVMTVVDPPKVIGYAAIGTAEAAQALAKGYAIMFIAKGRACQEATSAFPIKEGWVDQAVRSIYLQMSNGKSDCDAQADPAEKPLAIQLLNGINIKKP